MGLFSSKKKTTESFNQTQTGARTPTNPQWVMDGTQGLGADILNIGKTDPRGFVAGYSPLQQTAFGGAQSLVDNPNAHYGAAYGAISTANNSQTPYMTAAEAGPAQTYDGVRANQYLDDYMNPYLSQVVEATAADINHQAAIADQKAKSAATSAGAWSGNGAEVLRGITNANYSRDLASTIANLRAGGFNTALGAAQQDAGRIQQARADNASSANQMAALQAQLRQQAGLANQDSNNRRLDRYLTSAGLLGQIGSADADARARAVALAGDLGGIQRDVETDYRRAPLDVLGAQTQMWSGLPLDLFRGEQSQGSSTGSGTTTSKSGGLSFGDLANMAQAAAIAFSDERLKRNVETVGYDNKGRRWAEYEYVWEPGVRRRGVIAQEVLGTDPGAVLEGPNGFLMVDYAKLEA